MSRDQGFFSYLTNIQKNIPIRGPTDGTGRFRTVLVPLAQLFSNSDEDRTRTEILILRDKDEKKWSSLGDLISINLPVKPGNCERS